MDSLGGLGPSDSDFPRRLFTSAYSGLVLFFYFRGKCVDTRGLDAIPAPQASQSEGRRARSGASSTPRSSTVGVVARAQSALPGLSRAGANSSSSFAPRATGTATRWQAASLWNSATDVATCEPCAANFASAPPGRSSRRHHAAQDAREQRHKEDKLNLEAATESSMGQAEENLSYSGKTRQPCGAARRSRMAPMTASTQKTQSGSAAMRGGAWPGCASRRR